MSLLLIKDGTVVLESKIKRCDILIEDGIIKDIGKDLKHINGSIVDAKGMFVLPGGIDVHTHMELPVMGVVSADSFYTGTAAALNGGTTTIIDFANQTKGKNLYDCYNKWRTRADGSVCCDYGLHVSVTDVNETILKEVEKLFKEEGVVSFKTFLAYEALQIDSNSLKSLMKTVGRLGGLITNHAEIGDIIKDRCTEFVRDQKLTVENHAKAHPVIAEKQAIELMSFIAKETNCKCYIVHLSSKEGCAAVREAQEKGGGVLAESCLQYLCFDEKNYVKNDFKESSKFVCSPPLRDRASCNSLWKGIATGIIDTVATDHCPFTTKQKYAGRRDFRKIPNGVPGVEERMEVLFSEGVSKGKIDLNRFVEISSSNPAKIFGLYPQKGVIKVGSDGDIVIIDPRIKHKLSIESMKMNCDYSLYDGMELIGKIDTVIFRGRIVKSKKGQNFEKGRGRYIKRSLI